MAKNTGIGYRKGTVTGQTQVVNPATGHWTKRDNKTGQVVEQKRDKTPFKGVRKEKP